MDRQKVAARARAGELGPSWPIVVLMTLTCVACVGIMWRGWWAPKGSAFDCLRFEEATFALVGGSDVVSVATLALVRGTFAVIATGTLISAVAGPDLTISTMYFPKSGISKGELVPIKLRGLMRLSTFTMQCWTMLTVYFIGATACSMMVMMGTGVEPTIQGGDAGGVGSATAGSTVGSTAAHGTSHLVYIGLWLAFQLSFACSILVTVIVTFVLIPGVIAKGGDPSAMMLKTRPTIMHNCNVVFMSVDLLLNAMPIVPIHAVSAFLFGTWYVFFSWAWLRTSGVVYYPFMDPSLPWKMSVPIHLVLLAGLSSFFALGYGVSLTAMYLPLAVRVAVIAAACGCITWTPLHPSWLRRDTASLGLQQGGGVIAAGERGVNIPSPLDTSPQPALPQLEPSRLGDSFTVVDHIGGSLQSECIESQKQQQQQQQQSQPRRRWEGDAPRLQNKMRAVVLTEDDMCDTDGRDCGDKPRGEGVLSSLLGDAIWRGPRAASTSSSRPVAASASKRTSYHVTPRRSARLAQDGAGRRGVRTFSGFNACPPSP